MKYAFCVICNTTENIEHHHITPVCKGGDDHPHNFLSLCVEHHAVIHSVRPGSWAHRKKLQRIGIDKAKKAGKYKGRKPSIDRKELKRLWDSGLSAIEIAKQMNINRTTVYRLLPKEPYKKLKNGQYKLF